MCSAFRSLLEASFRTSLVNEIERLDLQLQLNISPFSGQFIDGFFQFHSLTEHCRHCGTSLLFFILSYTALWKRKLFFSSEWNASRVLWLKWNDCVKWIQFWFEWRNEMKIAKSLFRCFVNEGKKSEINGTSPSLDDGRRKKKKSSHDKNRCLSRSRSRPHMHIGRSCKKKRFSWSEEGEINKKPLIYCECSHHFIFSSTRSPWACLQLSLFDPVLLLFRKKTSRGRRRRTKSKWWKITQQANLHLKKVSDLMCYMFTFVSSSFVCLAVCLVDVSRCRSRRWQSAATTEASNIVKQITVKIGLRTKPRNDLREAHK